jgi:hypothetical protein
MNHFPIIATHRCTRNTSMSIPVAEDVENLEEALDSSIKN